MKRFLGFVLILSFVFTLCGCSAGISGDDAKELVSDFLEKVEEKDYNGAEEFLHPECTADLQAFFTALENDKGIDFSSIQIKRYTGYESSVYASDVDGSRFLLKMQISASGEDLFMEVEIVKNDSGYGIYHLRFNAD